MSRIRSTRQAARLRPIAVERARQGKFKPGDKVFLRGISYAPVRVVLVIDDVPTLERPNRYALVSSVANGIAFIADMSEISHMLD